VSFPKIYHSTCTVIPPHLQRHLADHGDAKARKIIAATLQHTAEIASEREATLLDPPRATRSRPKLRFVYDARRTTVLTARLVATERTFLIEDVDAKRAFDGSGAVYDFYAKVFHRNSIDDRGMPLISTVHYGKSFDNAMWNGRQMVYGDGDGKIFASFTADIDVIGHEISHGVTQSDAALEYQGQPGALSEHLSDASGIMIKQYWLAQTVAESDWLIGKGVLGPVVHGVALRSMKAPGTAYDDPLLGRDPQPAHMRDYVHSAEDNGGVHINSGILNHAFYLFAIAVGGYSWLVPGSIWNTVRKTRLSPQAGFQDFANATVIVAGELYGVGGEVQLALTAAWAAVGLFVTVLPKVGGGNPMRSPKWRVRPTSALA
jgi:Zn-dependent metalloprotease